MTQIEALQQQVIDLRDRVAALEADRVVIREGCIQLALAGQRLEERVARLEEGEKPGRNLFLPGGGLA